MKQGVEFNQLDIFFSLLLNNFSLSKEREREARGLESVSLILYKNSHMVPSQI